MTAGAAAVAGGGRWCNSAGRYGLEQRRIVAGGDGMGDGERSGYGGTRRFSWTYI